MPGGATESEGSNTKEPPISGPKSLSDLSGYAVGAIAVITAAAGLVGGFTGGVARVSRNSPHTLTWAVGLVFSAVIVAFIGGRLARPNGKPQVASNDPSQVTDEWRDRTGALLVGSAIALFAVAAIVTVTALSNSLATPDRPIVEAKWAQANGQTVLSGSVAASGMKTGDQLTVVAIRMVHEQQAVAAPSPPLPTPWQPPNHSVRWAGIVYQQQVGADMDGKATVAFEVPLPTGYTAMQVVASTTNLLECPMATPAGDVLTVAKERFSCVTLDAPPPLTASTSVASTTTITTTVPPA